MKKLLLLLFLASVAPSIAAESKSADGFVTIFDGSSLESWKANENPSTFKLENGQLVAHGERSHLFYLGDLKGHDFKNFHARVEVMTTKGANSGFFFHTAFQEKGWLEKGFEVQVNNTQSDPKKTGGLYGVKDNFTAPVKDDEWFTLEVIVEGNHVVTKVNGQTITDWTQSDAEGSRAFPKRVIDSGTFAIQGHDPGSRVLYRKIEVKPLD
jgi:hypothetical protein